MLSKELFELESEDVIIIHPPSFADFDIFVKLYLKAVDWYMTHTEEWGNLQLLLSFIVDKRCASQSLSFQDILNLLNTCQKFLSSDFCLPRLATSDNSQPAPNITPTKNEEADLLGGILYSYKELGWLLYNQCDRASFYQILNQLSQYRQWESELIKSSGKDPNPNVLPLIGENRKILEEALRQRHQINFDDRVLSDFEDWSIDND